jgi:hypothetical protein
MRGKASAAGSREWSKQATAGAIRINAGRADVTANQVAGCASVTRPTRAEARGIAASRTCDTGRTGPRDVAHLIDRRLRCAKVGSDNTAGRVQCIRPWWNAPENSFIKTFS